MTKSFLPYMFCAALLSINSARAGEQNSALMQNAADQLSVLTGAPVAVPDQPQAQRPAPATAAPEKIVAVGIIIEGNMTPATETALKAAFLRTGPLPAGVNMIIWNRDIYGDNPNIEITVDGRRVYDNYLYHSEASLGRFRRSLNPLTWYVPSEPSADLSKRFEAALTLAREGAEEVRAKVRARTRE